MDDGGGAGRARVRRWTALGVLVVVGAVIGLLVAVRTPTMYTASAESFVSSRPAASIADLQQPAVALQQSQRSFTALATAPFVLQQVIGDLHLATTPEALARGVVADSAPDTALVRIRVSDPSPAQAARIANAVQSTLTRTVASLTPSSSQGGQRLTAVRSAVPPTEPSSPNAAVDLLAGALLGAAAWLLIALVRALRRRRPPQRGGLAASSMF